MTDAIIGILTDHGPLLSGRLASLLAERTKVPLNTASQQITREKHIQKIKGFFKSNQSFCYLEQQVKDQDILEELMKQMLDNGKKHWYTLNIIKIHGGRLHRKYLECYTLYPVENLKKHIKFNQVMKKFVDENILIFIDEEYQFSPKITRISINTYYNKAIGLIKDQTIQNFSSFLRNTGLVSYNTVEIFSEYSKFRWGLKGSSYVLGIKSKGECGFVIADILLGKNLTLNEIDCFFGKIKNMCKSK